MLIINGKLSDKSGFEEVEAEIKEVISNFENRLKENDIDRTKILAESSIVFSEVELLNRSIGLAYAAFLGDTNMINMEKDRINAVTKIQILEQAHTILSEDNCTTLHYKAI